MCCIQDLTCNMYLKFDLPVEILCEPELSCSHRLTCNTTKLCYALARAV